MSGTKDWFKHWFNSNYYFLVYQNRNESEARSFVNLILNNIQINKDWKIIDFCCGYGRLCKIFAELGFKITGVDLSSTFIEKAKEIAASQKLNIKYFNCDVRKFNQPEKYDLGINFFTSFGYFSDEENEKTFQNFSSSIKKNGWLILDFFNAKSVAKNLIPFEDFTIDNKRVIVNRKIEDGRVVKSILIDSGLTKEKFIESVGLYDFNYFSKLFEANNFIIHKILGDYSGNEFDEDSPRLIIFANKK